MSSNMKCSYRLSSRLPSFFDRKHFSCTYMCFNKNVVDVCEEDSLEDSLLIESVQEKLLETAISISSLSERIINVLENSHLEDAVSLTKDKKKKMKRRKKRKQRTKCDVIKEDEIHPPNNFTLFENEYLSNNVPQWENYIPNYSQRCYDNTSFSHITSEKESAYSEDKLPNSVVVRKRKKLQRRKKRKPKAKTVLLNEVRNSVNCPASDDSYTHTHLINNCVSGKDDVDGSCDENEAALNNITPEKQMSKKCNQPSKDVIDTPGRSDCLNSDDLSDKNTHSNRDSDVRCEELLKTCMEQEYVSNRILDEDTKIVGEDTKIVGEDTKIIGEDTRIVGEVTTVMGREAKVIDIDRTAICDDTNTIDADIRIIGPIIGGETKAAYGDTFSGKVVNEETFSKEQRRQLRRKMRNVKKRPESYVVLGLI